MVVFVEILRVGWVWWHVILWIWLDYDHIIIFPIDILISLFIWMAFYWFGGFFLPLMRHLGKLFHKLLFCLFSLVISIPRWILCLVIEVFLLAILRSSLLFPLFCIWSRFLINLFIWLRSLFGFWLFRTGPFSSFRHWILLMISIMDLIIIWLVSILLLLIRWSDIVEFLTGHSLKGSTYSIFWITWVLAILFLRTHQARIWE